MSAGSSSELLDHEPDDPALAREVINLIQKLNDRVAPRRLRATPKESLDGHGGPIESEV